MGMSSSRAGMPLGGRPTTPQLPGCAAAPASARCGSISMMPAWLPMLATLPRLRPLLCVLPLLACWPPWPLESSFPAGLRVRARPPDAMLVALSWKPEKPLPSEVP